MSATVGSWFLRNAVLNPRPGTLMTKVEYQLGNNLKAANGNSSRKVPREEPCQQGCVERCDDAPGGCLDGTAPSALFAFAALRRHAPSDPRPTPFMQEVEHHFGDNFSDGNVGRCLQRITVINLTSKEWTKIGDNQPGQHQCIESAYDPPRHSFGC